MKLKVNMDHGIALNMDLIARLLRHDMAASETVIVMVSGGTFNWKVPLSEA